MRLEHTGEKTLQTLVKQGLLKSASTCTLGFCEHCVIRKKTKVRFGTATHCSERILDYIHIDVWGPIKMASIGCNHYFVSFIDDYSRMLGICHEAQRGSPRVFCGVKEEHEEEYKKKIKVLHLANGEEYISNSFLQLCRDEGIERHFTLRKHRNKRGWLKG